MPNLVAYLAIIFWPLFIIFVYVKYELRLAIVIAMFGSYLLLPASFSINIPGIPAFNKATVTTITLFLILYLKSTGVGFKALDGKSLFVLFLLIISPFITALTNSERYLYLPGMTLYDGLSESVGSFLIFIPFLIGANYFGDKESQRLIFKALVVSCLLYAPFILYEIRMSPQLHTNLYGFFPHSFIQQIRSGGFRSVVFLGHGLLVAFFVCISLIALVSFIKAKTKVLKISNYLVLAFLFVVLILSKTFGALILFLFAFGALFFLKPKTVGLLAMFIMVIYISYPFASASKVFPHDTIVRTIDSISIERAQSLNFRFFHESQLVLHANEKPIFGWGSWGRNRVYDPETFQDLSVTDGRWIITLGTRGWFGFLAEFYFIFISLWFAIKATKESGKLTREQVSLLSGHILIVGVILIDQIPNASLSYFYWFIIGALYGRSKYILKNGL